MATLQRPCRGSRVSSFYPIKSLPPLSSLDSAFQLQEYISLLIRLDVHDVDAIVTLPERLAQKDQDESPDPAEPETKKSEDGDRKSDISVDRACWIYEQLRRLAQDLSHPLITMLQQECTRSSCPQMKAGEWLYLCVAHGNDGAMEQCCAIDYILHTVDSATALLNSPRAFPSRLSIPQTSHRHFASLARRLGRIFAHAYFHHREAFEQAEAESSLYARFLKLTNLFDLVPAEFLVIPESALHHDDKGQPEEVEPPRLFSAAVHPSPIHIDSLTATSATDDDQVSNSRSKAADTPINQVGSDSPRKLGRSRTDTMVFSEAFNMTEESSRSSDGGGLLGSSPMAETESLISEPSWADLETRADDLDDEDIGDARSDLTLTGSLSPPVETLPLISLEETPPAATLDDASPRDTPSEPPPRSLLDETPAEATEASAEEPVQGTDAPEDSVAVDETSTAAVAEPAPEEEGATTTEALTETTEIIHVPEECGAGLTSENAERIPLPSDEEPESPEVHAESKVAAPPEDILELHEPPPSEPIPPESESDITDEVGGDDRDEQKTSEEEEAVVS